MPIALSFSYFVDICSMPVKSVHQSKYCNVNVYMYTSQNEMLINTQKDLLIQSFIFIIYYTANR